MSSNISLNNNVNFVKDTTKRFNRSSKLEQDLKNLQKRIHSPKVDLIERGNYFLVRIELPGVDINSINIQIKDSQIILISGAKATNTSYEIDRVVYRESKYDSFTRRVKLPGKVKQNYFDKNSLDFANGVLHLTFEKDTTVVEDSLPENLNVTQNWSEM